MPVLQPPWMPLTDQYTIMGSGWLDASHINVNIGGMTIFMDAASYQEVDSIGARSTLQFIADDLNGQLIFVNGEHTQIWSAGGLNQFTAQQSTLINGNANGFTALNGATLSAVTSPVWNGTYSLQVACLSGGHEGFYCVTGSNNLVAGVSYVASCWLYCATSVSLNIHFQYVPVSGPTVVLTSFTMQLPAGVWTRVSIPYVMAPTIPAGSYGIQVALNQAFTGNYYADGFQLEQDRDVSPWHLGGTWGGTKLFEGVMVDAQRVRVGYSSVYQIQIQCVDWHYLADKRIVQSSWQYETTGQIVRWIVDNILSQEGVTYQRGCNLLTAQQSDVESTDMTPFSIVNSGVTLVQDTTVPYHGLGDLKVTTDGTGANQGLSLHVPITASNFPQGGTIAISAYIRASTGTPSVRLYVSNPSTTGPITVAPLTTTYQRFTAYMPIPNPIVGTYYALHVDTVGTEAITFYMDEMQMEIIEPTVWSPGGAGGNLLNLQQADVESSDMTQFIAVLGSSHTTLSQDTTTAWSNLASLKVVTAGTSVGEGAEVDIANSAPIVIPANSWVCYSVYMKAPTSMSVVFNCMGGNFLSQVFTLTPNWQRFNLVFPAGATPPSNMTFQVITSSAQAGTFWMDGLKVELLTVPTTWELGGLQQTVFDGVTLINYTAPYTQASKNIDDLAQYSGFLWYIDVNRLLWFQLPTTSPAPWTYDGTQGVYASQTIETTSPLYRNTQWIYNIPDITGVQTETRHGDGTSQSFTFSYPLAQAPKYVTLNGTAQTVGVKGVDDTNHTDQWYWAANDATLAHDTNIAALATTDTLIMQYIGRWTSAVYSQNQAQVGNQAVVEGTSGIVEEAHSDPTVTTAAQGFQLAQALLDRYGVQGQQITFDTRASGLQKGQMLSINMLSPGWGMSGGGGVLALIEQIQTVIVGPWFYYTITAIVGPFNANWVQFYQQLSQVAQAGNSAATNQVVNILQTFSANWAWAASLNVTVLTCPIVAPTLLCGPSVIVC